MDDYIFLDDISEKELYEKMMRKMYGDDIPVDAYDFPSGAILTPCEEDESDYHIKIIGSIEPNEITNEPFFCPTIIKQSEVTKTNRKTFQHSPGINENFTLFDDALKNFLELLVILKFYNKQTKNLETWFKIEWGLERSISFNKLLPHIINDSENPFSTLDKNLVPAMIYNRESTAHIEVKSHGVLKTKFEGNKLVDWPRIQAILQTIGNLMYIEGVKDERFDYKIVPHNLPDAYYDFNWNDDAIVVNDDNYICDQNMMVFNDIIRFSTIEQKEVTDDDNIILKKEDVSKFHEMSVKNILTLPIAEDINRKRNSKEEVLEDLFEFEEDIVIEKTKPKDDKSIKHIRNKDYIDTSIGNYYNNLKNIVKRLGNFDKITDLDYFQMMIILNSKKIPDDIFKAAFNKEILHAVVFGERFKFESDTELFKSVVGHWQCFGIPQNLWTVSDLELLYNKCEKLNKVRIKVCELVMDIIKSIHYERVTFPKLEAHVYSYIRRNNDVIGGMSRFVKARKNYWSNYYRIKARSKIVKNDKVKYQIRAKLFNVIRIGVKNKVEFNRQKYENVVNDICENYIRKRVKYNDKEKFKTKTGKEISVKNLPKMGNNDVRLYTRRIDDYMEWDIKLYDIMEKTITKGKMLSSDLARIFATCVDYELDEEVNNEEEDEPEPVKKEEPEEIKPVVPAVNLWDFDDDEMEEEYEVPVYTKVPVVQNLIEDDDEMEEEFVAPVIRKDLDVEELVAEEHYHYAEEVTNWIKNKYGNRLTVKVWLTVRDEAMKFDISLLNSKKSAKVDASNLDIDD